MRSAEEEGKDLSDHQGNKPFLDWDLALYKEEKQNQTQPLPLCS